MKVLYNWLKEFVDVKAAPSDLKARLSLAGVAIDSVEESVAGPVLDAEVTANRPDCLGPVSYTHLDVYKRQAHLMSHHGLDFFGRSAAKKIVIERDAHGLSLIHI